MCGDARVPKNAVTSKIFLNHDSRLSQFSGPSTVLGTDIAFVTVYIVAWIGASQQTRP
jgi:hypothetical protein